MSVRVSPSERIRAEIDALFGGARVTCHATIPTTLIAKTTGFARLPSRPLWLSALSASRSTTASSYESAPRAPVLGT